MERYGTVPKRFSKEWWEYFWTYYKWHVVITALILSMAAVAVVQLTTKIRYDVTVTYIGTAEFEEENSTQFGNDFAEIIDDVNGNGRKDVLFQILAIAKPGMPMENPQYTMGIETKKIIEIQMGETMLFLLDEEQALQIYEHDIADGLFVEADAWLSPENIAAERAPGEAGECFVRVAELAFFEKRGFKTNSMYAGIRKLRDQDELPAQAAAFDIANHLLRVK